MVSSGKRRDLLISLLVPAALLILAVLLIDFGYERNDDLAMINIFNGSYSGTPDAHGVFLLYPLALVFPALYTLCSTISWYQVVLFLIYWIAMASLLYRLLRRITGHTLLVTMGFLASFTLLWLNKVMCITFTSCAAFVGFSAVLCYSLMGKDEDTKPLSLLQLVGLFVLTYCLRDYLGLLVFPFMGAVWLCKHSSELFKNRKCWLVPLAALLAFGAVSLINQIAYADWQDYYAYNDDRCYLQDYQNYPRFRDHEEFIRNELGFTEAGYHAIRHYDYGLLSDFSPETIHDLAEYARGLEKERSLLSLAKHSLKQGLSMYLPEDPGSISRLQLMSYLMPIAAGLAVVIFTIRTKRWHSLLTLTLFLGIAGSWLYVGYQGRLTPPVASSMQLLTVVSSLAAVFLLLPEKLPDSITPKTERTLRILSVILAAAAVYGFADLRIQEGPSKNPDVDYIAYIEEHPENIYIRDTEGLYVHPSNQEEFPRVPFNSISSGSWVNYSPIYDQKLERLGIEALNRDLLLEDNVFLVVKKSNDLNLTLGVGTGADVEFEVIEEFSRGIQIVQIKSIQFKN